MKLNTGVFHFTKFYIISANCYFFVLLCSNFSQALCLGFLGALLLFSAEKEYFYWKKERIPKNRSSPFADTKNLDYVSLE